MRYGSGTVDRIASRRWRTLLQYAQ